MQASINTAELILQTLRRNPNVIHRFRIHIHFDRATGVPVAHIKSSESNKHWFWLAKAVSYCWAIITAFGFHLVLFALLLVPKILGFATIAIAAFIAIGFLALMSAQFFLSMRHKLSDTIFQQMISIFFIGLSAFFQALYDYQNPTLTFTSWIIYDLVAVADGISLGFLNAVTGYFDRYEASDLNTILSHCIQVFLTLGVLAAAFFQARIGASGYETFEGTPSALAKYLIEYKRSLSDELPIEYLGPIPVQGERVVELLPARAVIHEYYSGEKFT